MKHFVLDTLARASLVLVALFALLVSSHARPPGGEGEHRPPHGPPPVVAALDTDKDGVISADEIAAAAESLKTLDQNGDGELTVDELRPPRPERD